MKRTTTEILIEVEETVRMWKAKRQSAADEETIKPTMVETLVCPLCGDAFSPAEHSENQNE